jgi:hypothetical protein
MEERKDRDVGLRMTAVGVSFVVLAVLLFGLTTEDGGPDWVSIITAFAGAVTAIIGLYVIFRNRPTTPGHTAPHAAS